MSDSYLQRLVIQRCQELGDEKAAEFFAVGRGLVRQWVNGSKTPSLAAVEKVFAVPEVVSAEAGWNDKEVFIALPFYKTTSPRTLFALLGVWDRAKFRAGLEFDNAVLIDAREKLADAFLKANVPWCWTVDDDCVFPMGNAGWFNRYAEVQLPEKFAGIHTPTRLRSHGKTIVSAVNFERRDKGRACYHEALLSTPEGVAENRRAHRGPADELRPTEWAGMACMMFHRQVLLDVQAKFPHLAPEHPTEPFHFFTNASDGVMQALPELKDKIETAAALVGSPDEAKKILADAAKQIDSAVEANRRNSRLQQREDQTFGRRAAAAGHTTFVDHAVHCSHLGQRAYNVQNTQ